MKLVLGAAASQLELIAESFEESIDERHASAQFSAAELSEER